MPRGIPASAEHPAELSAAEHGDERCGPAALGVGHAACWHVQCGTAPHGRSAIVSRSRDSVVAPAGSPKTALPGSEESLGWPTSIARRAPSTPVNEMSSMPAASASSRTRRGGTSREIVELALTGLACVRHRQAIAADGISGDGAGLLVPIPRPFFARVGGEELGRELDADRLGVVSAFLDVGDDDAVRVAETAVADACAAEGHRAGRVACRPDRRDAARRGGAGRPARRSGTAILLRPDDVDDADAERARVPRPPAGGAPPAARRTCATTSRASRSSTVTYKALVISDRLAAFYPDLAADDFGASLGDLPQPLLDEHDAGVGAGPAVPHAVPQRRDQHRRAATSCA